MDHSSASLPMDCSMTSIKHENEVLDLSSRPAALGILTPPRDASPLVVDTAPNLTSSASPPSYRSPTVTYPSPTMAYPSPTMAYPTPTLAYASPTLAYPSPTLAFPSPTLAYPSSPLAYHSPTQADSTSSLEATERVLIAAQTQNIRPFKAYSQDLASLPVVDEEAFVKFRETMLKQMRASKAHPRKSTSPTQNPRKTPNSNNSPQSKSDELKDAAYYERRRKNNIAAKRSRDSRRSKEDEIAIRAAFYERGYNLLKYNVELLTQENEYMKRLLFNRNITNHSGIGVN